MKVEIKHLEKSEVEISVEVSAEVIMAKWPQAVKEIQKLAEVDGFRKGHVPESVVLSRFGDMAVLEEAAQMVVQEVYPAILKEHKIDAIGYPQVKITKLAKDNPLAFVLTTAILPEITLPDYKKIASDSQKEKENREIDKGRLEMFNAISDATKVEIPNILIESELDRMIAQLKHDVTQFGGTFESYLEHIKKTEEVVRAEWKIEAERRAKVQMIMNEIASKEKLTPGEDEVMTQVEQARAQYKDADEEQLKAYFSQVLQNQKVMNFLEK